MPNTQVRTYVHGALYSLVGEPAVLEAAQRRGLADVLTAVAAASEPLFQRHIAHILRRLGDAEGGGGAESAGGEEEELEDCGDDDAEADDVDAMEYDDEYEEMEAAMTSGARELLLSILCVLLPGFVVLCKVHPNCANVQTGALLLGRMGCTATALVHATPRGRRRVKERACVQTPSWARSSCAPSFWRSQSRAGPPLCARGRPQSRSSRHPASAHPAPSVTAAAARPLTRRWPNSGPRRRTPRR